MPGWVSLYLNFDPFPVLATPRLILRAITQNDASDMFAMRSNIDAMKHIARPMATSIDDAIALITKIEKMIAANEGIAWGIVLPANNKVIGTMSYHIIDKENFRAHVGYLLHPLYWKQGIADEALKVVLHYGFTTMNLHSIEAHVDPNNNASMALLHKNNFIHEASFRENYFFQGQFLDTNVYSLLRNNWQA